MNREVSLSDRAKEEFRRYNKGLSNEDSLMSLKAIELKWAINLKWPKSTKGNKRHKPTRKADMVSYLLKSMPTCKPSYHFQFDSPVPVGAIEIKRRADAAVRDYLGVIQDG